MNCGFLLLLLLMDVHSRERFVSLLTCAVGQLCKSGLIDSELFVSQVDGLLGITLSNGEVFLINICECFHCADSFGSPTQDHNMKISAKTSASSSLTQSNATGRATTLTNKVQTISKQTTDHAADFLRKPCKNLSFQAQSAGEAILNSSSNLGLNFVQPLATAVDANIKTYDRDIENHSQTCTFIKVEENSNDGLQMINDCSDYFSQKLNEPNCPPLEQKHSTSLLGKLEPVEESSSPFNTRHYLIDDSSYITSSSFADPGDGYPSASTDFIASDPKMSYESYHQPIYPLSSSSQMTTSHLSTFPAVTSNKQLVAWQKHFAPHGRNQRLKTRKRCKYHYETETLKECIELVRNYKMSQREAERVFQIPRTTIQVKLAQMYPNWVAPPRQTFTKRNIARAPQSCAVGVPIVRG